MAKRSSKGAALFGLSETAYTWIKEEVAKVTGPQTPTSYGVTALATGVKDLLFAADAKAEAWASAAIEALALYALKSVVKDVQDDRSLFFLDGNGRIIGMPTHRGIRPKQGDGTSERLYQQTLWYEMTWQEFRRYIARLIMQRNTLDDLIEGLSLVLSLEKSFPDTKTPGEACERAGIDPRQFKLVS